MHRSSILFTILAVLCAVLVVEAGRVPRPSRPSRPSRPTRPRPPVIARPRPPVVVHRPTTPGHKPPVVVHRPTTPGHKPPVVVHRPTTPGGTRPPQGSPLPSHGPSHPPSSTRPGSHPSPTPSNGPPSSPVDRSPSPPPTALDQASGCRAYTTCDTCAAHSTRRNVNIREGNRNRRVAVSCAWLQTTAQDTGRCVTMGPGVSHPANALSTSAQQCTALHTAVQNRHIVTSARRHWAGMQSHTFDGDATGRAENGRHLVSSWIRQFPDDTLSTNDQTKFAKSPKGKTMWMDTAAAAPYTGPWTKTQIQTMCISALEASIREHAGDGRQTPTSQRSDEDYRPMSGQHAYSVASPLGGNVCLTIFQTYSCFPAALGTTSKPVGQKCAMQGQMLP